MLDRKQIEEIVEEVEDGLFEVGKTSIAGLWTVLLLLDIRDQIERLGDTINSLRIDLEIRDTFKKTESEGTMQNLQNKRTGEVFETHINESAAHLFIVRALISLGVLEEIPKPAPAEKIEEAEKDFEKSVNEKAVAGAKAAADKAGNDQARAEQAAAIAADKTYAALDAARIASERLTAQKAAEKTAADEARAKLNQDQQN